MAIEASAPAVAELTHQDIRNSERRVIEDQRREIGKLEAIRAVLSGEGTPAAS